MRVRLGDYRLPHGATDVQISKDPVLGARGQPVEHVVTWNMRTRLHNPGSNPLQFTMQLQQLESVLARDGFDVVIETEAGESSFHALISSQCIGGTRVVRAPSYPTGRRGQLVTHRDIQFAVQGRVPVLFGYTDYISFQETIAIKGGGARWGCREVNYGPGVRQQLRTHSICTATQSGSATGHMRRPDFPPPIWPDARVDEFPEITDVSPRITGSGANAAYSEFQRSWSYTYEYPTRLSGAPSLLT